MRPAADQISYEDLYARWEAGNWSATGIDFSEDARHWRERFSDLERDAALWNYALFFWGEDAVADGLSPYIDAAPREEQKYFLATQQVDEARHAVFFSRFMHEVAGVPGEGTGSRLAAIEPQLTWGFRKVFDRLERMSAELRRRPTRPNLAAAITRTRAAPPLVRAGVFTSTALIYALRRDVAVAGEHARRALELAAGLPAWFSYASAVEGWVRAVQGDPAGGARVLRASLDEIRSRGARHLVGWVLGLLAEAEALAGDTGEGLRLLDEARALVAQTGERMYEAELDRLRGELLQRVTHT